MEAIVLGFSDSCNWHVFMGRLASYAYGIVIRATSSQRRSSKFFKPELAGGWALSGLGQNKVLEPTRKWGVQQVGTEDRAGITGWGWCLEPGRNLAGGVVREKREGFMTSLGQEHLLRTGSQEVLHSTSTPGVATVENRTEILKKKKKNTAIGMTQKFSSWVYI